MGKYRENHIFQTPLVPKAWKTKGEKIAVRVQEKKRNRKREFCSHDWGANNWYLSTNVVLWDRDTWQHKMKLWNIVLVDFSQIWYCLQVLSLQLSYLQSLHLPLSQSTDLLSASSVPASLLSFSQTAAGWTSSSSVL